MAKKKTEKAPQEKVVVKETGILWSMSHAPKIEEGYHWFQTAVLAVWTAVIIMLMRAVTYEMDLSQFFWTNQDLRNTDFFSYCKMVAILIVAALVILILLYRLLTQSFILRKSMIYIPMIIYSVFVLISYFMSEYKEIAWLGYNDRFEGTIVLLAYMLVLFYAINTIYTEKQVKIVVYAIGITSAMLGILGITQAIGKDFFRTTIGQKLITPNAMTDTGLTVHQMIDAAAEKGELFYNFTFKNNEIYQTVYNINYVSFYLTLLIPLFGLLFMHFFTEGKKENMGKIICFGLLFALLGFNLIGSASSGGFFGMAIVVLFAFVLLNKRILRWWKPVALLLVITALVAGVTYERWIPEVSHTIKGASKDTAVAEEISENNNLSGHLDYIETTDGILTVSVDDVEIKMTMDTDTFELGAVDISGNEIDVNLLNAERYEYELGLDAFKNITFQPVMDDGNNKYIIMTTTNPEEKKWAFLVDENKMFYLNDLNKLVMLEKVPIKGFEDNLNFGSGRGFIWSRTIPMMSETIIKGFGADTYALYFPQGDYAGKYSAKWNINMIVDKPHNMFMHMWIGTGGISCLAFIAILIMYAIQSFKTYWRRDIKNFLEITGVGIFLGIMGFAFTGLVDDSSVSVMPLFYGLLGLGISINMILKTQEGN